MPAKAAPEVKHRVRSCAKDKAGLAALSGWFCDCRELHKLSRNNQPIVQDQLLKTSILQIFYQWDKVQLARGKLTSKIQYLFSG